MGIRIAAVKESRRQQEEDGVASTAISDEREMTKSMAIVSCRVVSCLLRCRLTEENQAKPRAELGSGFLMRYEIRTDAAEVKSCDASLLLYHRSIATR